MFSVVSLTMGNTPIRMGDVVLENLLNTNIDLIASMDIDRA